MSLSLELGTSFGGYDTNKAHKSHIYTTQTITDGKKKRKNRPLRGDS